MCKLVKVYVDSLPLLVNRFPYSYVSGQDMNACVIVKIIQFNISGSLHRDLFSRGSEEDLVVVACGIARNKVAAE